MTFAQVVKTFTVGALITVALFLLVWAFNLLVWAFNSDTKKALAHNDQQIAECREMGGFPRTNVDGWLLECSR